MRLRLTVQRNSLPAVNILWNVPETNSNSAYTITRLLEDVNHILPLEAEQWGLDDYAVEVGGFECLHFSPVTQALKEDDHVSIRPLMTAEVRARTLTGRLQISEGGQHLIDGVPFGRPYLRTPHRPAVRIPPRKRQRADEQEVGEMREARDWLDALLADPDSEPRQQIEDTPSGSAAHIPPRKRPRLQRDNKEVSDAVLTAFGEKSPRNGLGHVHQGGGPASPSGSVARTRPSKRQRREEREAKEDMALASCLAAILGPMDGDDAPHNNRLTYSNPTPGPSHRAPSKAVQFKQPVAENLGDSADDDDDDDDFVSSDVDSDSEGSSSGSDTSSSDSDSDSSSDSDSDSDSNASSPDILSSKDGLKQPPNLNTKPVSSKIVAPGEGRSATKLRNSRRTRTNRLRYLKEIGELNTAATLADLREYEEAKNGTMEQRPALAHPFSAPSGKTKHLDSGETIQDSMDVETSELELRKQELMARLGHSSSGTVQAEDSTSPDIEATHEPTPKIPNENQPVQKEPPTRRMRPDTSAISRILARQAARPTAKKSEIKPVDENPPEPEGASEPDFWKSRVNLSAFECWEEQYELSTPPFPFQQHWDPASKSMRDKKHKGKKKSTKPEPSAEAPPSEDEGEKIVLNYDDALVEESPDAEINAAIEDQLRQDVAVASQEADLPPVPEDVTTLPLLTSADIKQGAVLVCKFFAVNPITITPEISDYKTAVVEKEGDSGNGAGTIQLKIAARDLPRREKKFDKKGKRIYDAGDAFLMEDDEEEEEGLWEGQFGELLEAKLLQAAE